MENRFKKLREEEHDKRRDINPKCEKFSQDKLSQEMHEQTGIYISTGRIKKVETDNPEVSIDKDLILAYKRFFNVTADWLIDENVTTRYPDGNTAIISTITGLSDDSVETLKIWNEYRKKPLAKSFKGYGKSDIDSLNLILEDWYILNKKSIENGLMAGFSLFHHIGNYLFSDNYRKQHHIDVRYAHKSEEDNLIHFSPLKKGDKVNEIDVLGIVDTDVDDFKIYNIQDSEEEYSVNFSDVMKSYYKDNIMTIIDRIKNRISNQQSNNTIKKKPKKKGSDTK